MPAGKIRVPPPTSATALIARLITGVSTVLPSPVAPYHRTLKIASVDVCGVLARAARVIVVAVAAMASGDHVSRSLRRESIVLGRVAYGTDSDMIPATLVMFCSHVRSAAEWPALWKKDVQQRHCKAAL